MSLHACLLLSTQAVSAPAFCFFNLPGYTQQTTSDVCFERIQAASFSFLNSHLCICLFSFGCAGSSLPRRLFFSGRERGYSLVAMFWLLSGAASVVVALRLYRTGPAVAAHGLSCSTACGVIVDQKLNPCLLPWQADSVPLCHLEVLKPASDAGSLLFPLPLSVISTPRLAHRQ